MPKSLLIALALALLGSCTSSTGSDSRARMYPVTRVVDGDTFWVDNGSRKGMKIRIIGVDAPETQPSQFKEVGFYGEEAKAFLEQLIGGEAVSLEFDVDSLDQYGRTLAYAYLSDGTFVNAELIKGGYARMVTYPPNVKYVDEFRKLQREARRANRGLWSRD